MNCMSPEVTSFYFERENPCRWMIYTIANASQGIDMTGTYGTTIGVEL